MAHRKRITLATLLGIIAVCGIFTIVSVSPGLGEGFITGTEAQAETTGVEPVLGLEHVALNVNDPAEVAEWFVTNLDMKIARKLGGASNPHFIADAAGKSMLELYHNSAAPVPDYAAMDPIVLHIAFTVKNVSAARDRLLAAGATLEDEVRTTEAGDVLAIVRSPHGLPVQLANRADPMLD